MITELIVLYLVFPNPIKILSGIMQKAYAI